MLKLARNIFLGLGLSTIGLLSSLATAALPKLELIEVFPALKLDRRSG